MGEPLEEPVEELEDAPAATPRPAARRAAPASTPAPQRASIVGAFRSSFRPMDLRGDLRALPRLLLTKSFLIPLDLAGAVFIWWAYTANAIPAILMQYVAYPFAVAPVFAVGFFATRASYLLGAIVGAAATFFTIPLLVAVGADSTAIGALAIQNAVYGAFFGAAAAWYRRFLNRANPNLARTAQPTTSRRTDGKIPRKPQQRPMLARRR